jgi:UDP-hydrolysing UDP-N-acetyl-D-glucosamine 2-epimerase
MLGDSIDFNLEKPYFLVTFHPVTLEKNTSEGQFQALLDALDIFPEYNVVFTKANADTDGRVINHMIDEYVAKHTERCICIASLGALRYLSAMKYATAVIGNSSSGIVETPSFKVPTINIGDRQKGRVMAASIINCDPLCSSIKLAISKSVLPEFQRTLSGVKNPYEQPETASQIVSVIKKIETLGLLKKKFFKRVMGINSKVSKKDCNVDEVI